MRGKSGIETCGMGLIWLLPQTSNRWPWLDVTMGFDLSRWGIGHGSIYYDVPNHVWEFGPVFLTDVDA